MAPARIRPPDLQGFGRRDIAMSPDEAYDYILYQIGALQAFCHAAGARMHHVKPHGQLDNRAAVDPELARAVAAAVHDANLDLVLVGLANSELIRAGQAEGISTAQEFFADRNYTDEGLLVSRKLPDAVITDEDFAVARVVRAVKEGAIESASGKLITVKPDTICIHGDNVHALEFAGKIRTALTEAGVEVKPVEQQRRRATKPQSNRRAEQLRSQAQRRETATTNKRREIRPTT